MSDRERAEPRVDWVNTSAGGEHAPGNESAGGAVGSGANPITRAGLRNADPDGSGFLPPDEELETETRERR